MSNLSGSMSSYPFTSTQQNALAAPLVGQYFAEQEQVFTQNNASVKAHYGTSTVDQISYDAGNRQMFNPNAELGLDCGRANTAGGRPDLGLSGPGMGSACPAPSTSFQKAAMSMDAQFNAYAPNARQLVLAQGDTYLAPARFADQNNYGAPSVSDFTYQSRLMGTRDVASSGCVTDQESGLSMCALTDDPLPYPSSGDPRTAYGVDSPNSQYWSGDYGITASTTPKLCHNIAHGSYPDSTSAMCNLQSVHPRGAPGMLPQYDGQR
jgi:hypothetical protein